jgi:DNA primase
VAKPGDVLAALDDLGIYYTVRGNEASALCPNPKHNDHSPSWSCNIETGQHNCFVCDDFGGAFPSLVMVVLGLKWREANEWCRKFLRSWDAIAAGLEEAPVRKRIVVSESDLAFTGKLWGWQEKGDDYFRNWPKQVPKSETLFGYRLLEEDCWATLVESPLDAPRMLSAGVPFVVASYGVDVSTSQLELIVDRCRGLTSALDNDEAGDRVCAGLRTGFRLPLKFFNYGKSGAKDPGEMSDEQVRYGDRKAIPSYLL